MRRRRPESLEVYSLSFLDLLSCGLGAVVILFLIADSRLNNAAKSPSILTISFNPDQGRVAGFISLIPLECSLLINDRETVKIKVKPLDNTFFAEVASANETRRFAYTPEIETNISLRLKDGVKLNLFASWSLVRGRFQTGNLLLRFENVHHRFCVRICSSPRRAEDFSKSFSQVEFRNGGFRVVKTPYFPYVISQFPFWSATCTYTGCRDEFVLNNWGTTGSRTNSGFLLEPKARRFEVIQ